MTTVHFEEGPPSFLGENPTLYLHFHDTHDSVRYLKMSQNQLATLFQFLLSYIRCCWKPENFFHVPLSLIEVSLGPLFWSRTYLLKGRLTRWPMILLRKKYIKIAQKLAQTTAPKIGRNCVKTCLKVARKLVRQNFYSSFWFNRQIMKWFLRSSKVKFFRLALKIGKESFK